MLMYSDIPLTYQRKVLCNHHLHAMVVPGSRCNANAIPTSLLRLVDLVSLRSVWRSETSADTCSSLIYGGFCILTLVWVVFCVPETRGVPLGRPMDEVFGIIHNDIDDDDMMDESSALLQNERIRKASFTSIH